MVVQPCLCGTWSETPKTGFLRTRLISGKSVALLITLTPWSWFSDWQDGKVKKRGEDYEALKDKLGRQMWKETEELFPKLAGTVRKYEPRHEKTSENCPKTEDNCADQLRGYRKADQRLCFRYTASTIPLLSKSEILSL